jgi:hypothetical protein
VLVPALVWATALVAGCTVSTGASPRPVRSAPSTPSASASPTPTRHDPVATAQPAPRELPGSSRWKLTRPATGSEIEGYANPTSILPGHTVRLMVSTTASHFRAYAYRIGGYRSGAGRLVWMSRSRPGRRQPPPALAADTRTVVAGWPASLSVDTTDWPPGFYLVKLVAASGYQSYVPLTVRSASTSGRIALVAPTMDWQAYNTWGGYSLYEAPPGRLHSWAVSFDRPNEAPGAGQFLYNVLGTVVLGERLGLPLAYESDTDVATRPALLRGARAYVSLGHDEYWTAEERRQVTRARDAGMNIAFLSSNTMYWRVRLAATPEGPHRLVVGYKGDATIADPLRLSDPVRTTARWRDGPHPDPENSLTGTLYECFPVDAPYRVATPGWWGFRGLGVREGTELPHLVGEEADRVYPLASTPSPLQVLSNVSYDCDGVPTSSQSTYYTTSSGAGVIDFGTQKWACAVKPRCGNVPVEDDRFVRGVMRNVLREFAKGPVGRLHPAHSNVADYLLPTVNTVPAS